jgi:hypothetical protein
MRHKSTNHEIQVAKRAPNGEYTTVILEPGDRLVCEEEAASILGVQAGTLRRWRWQGRGPVFCKYGRAVRYQLSSLASFVIQNSVAH